MSKGNWPLIIAALLYVYFVGLTIRKQNADIVRLYERQEILIERLNRLDPICGRGDSTASYDPTLCRP